VEAEELLLHLDYHPQRTSWRGLYLVLVVALAIQVDIPVHYPERKNVIVLVNGMCVASDVTVVTSVSQNYAIDDRRMRI